MNVCVYIYMHIICIYIYTHIYIYHKRNSRGSHGLLRATGVGTMPTIAGMAPSLLYSVRAATTRSCKAQLRPHGLELHRGSHQSVLTSLGKAEVESLCKPVHSGCKRITKQTPNLHNLTWHRTENGKHKALGQDLRPGGMRASN